MTDLLLLFSSGLGIILELVIIFLALSIARKIGRAPKGWYLFIVGTAFLIVRSTILFLSAISNYTPSDILIDFFTILFGVSVAVGLFYLRRDFIRAIKSTDWKTLTSTSE